MKVFVNGRIEEGDGAGISFFNKHAFFNFGCYDNVKILRGKPVFAREHAERFIQSLKTLGITPPKENEILDAVNQLVLANKLDNALIRLVMYPDFFYAFTVGLTFYPDKFYSKGVKAVTYEGERILPQAKTMSTLLNYLAYTKAEKENALEALLVNANNEITEGTRSNFFIVEKEKIITPPKEQVLDGVTRQLVMQEFEVKEERVTLERALKAGECFITSTSKLAMPLNRIDDNNVSTGQIARKVYKRLQELEGREITGKASV